jgi:RimJ/RimL family protein N-acetyltransferase
LPAPIGIADNRPVPQTSDFATKPTLTGHKVVLRPFADNDLPAMLAALQDPEAVKLTGSAHDDAAAAAPMDPAAQTAAREWYATRNEQAGRLDLAVTDRGDGRCVGEAVLNEWDAENRSCNFRILLGAAGRGRGLGTEATRLIIGHGFGYLGLHRISLEVYAFNPRARHVYEKAGFRAEGVLREALRYNDQWIDATVMSILDHEWVARHG